MNTTRTTIGLLVALLLAIGGSASIANAQAGHTTLSVMTRNQYIGSDLATLTSAPDLASLIAAARAVLMEVAANNFPERAQALAREIAERRPHIVGLQEVEDFRLNSTHGAPPFVDQLELTLAALDELGAEYVAIASVQNLELTVPVDLDGDFSPESLVTVTDRDVILARRDLVDAGIVVPVPFSTICARPSIDGGPGCNYTVVAVANTPAGTISIERGFVAVDVALGGRIYRVVNTHLEIENLDPADALSPFIQSAQATELKGLLDATSAGRSVIVLGDLNSTPDDPPFPDPVSGPFVRPYQQLANGVDVFGAPTAGGAYLDTWERRPGKPPGWTCCEPNLLSPEFDVKERKDLVFVGETPAAAQANLVGNKPEDKTPSGLWPSDHAGVWVRIRMQ
jgi:endonuclease/exonuclease/phosphatase family metal-dependent hydrolase